MRVNYLQIECGKTQKKKFWQDIYKVMQGVQGIKDVVIGGNMNRYVGND